MSEAAAGLPTLISFHGELDRVNPFTGSGGDYWQQSVPDALVAWAQHHGHEATPTEVSSPNDHVQCIRYGQGPGRLELHVVDDLGHIWPGYPRALGAPLDPPSSALDATGYLMRVFAEHWPCGDVLSDQSKGTW